MDVIIPAASLVQAGTLNVMVANPPQTGSVTFPILLIFQFLIRFPESPYIRSQMRRYRDCSALR
jgi:hypothetical protein